MKKLLALALLAFSPAVFAVEYNVAVLGSLSGSGNSGAFGMNDSGQVVGYSYNSATARNEAVVWNNGIVQSLGVEGIARAVNNSGTVVGKTGPDGLSDVILSGQAFKWDPVGGYVNLGTLGTGLYAGATDINEAGVIIGDSYKDQSPLALAETRAFRWENGTMTDLGTVSSPTGYSRANGLNDSGTVVGRASLVDFIGSEKHLAVWDAANNLTSTVGPFAYSNGGDVNNSGIIAGNSQNAAGKQRATIWDGTNVTQLGTLGGDNSHFEAINAAGVAVGRSEFLIGNNQTRAIVSFDGVAMVDLNTLVDLTGTGFVSLDEAWDINDNGDIVGFGTLESGAIGAFQMSVVPIPAAVWLFGSALGALGWFRRRGC